MTEIIRKYKILNGLSGEFVEEIEQIFVFGLKYTDSKNVLIVMVGGDVLVKGPNSLGELGLGHNNIVNELTRLEEFCDKRVVNIFSGADHMVALTQSGRVYCWGANHCGQMGNGTPDSNFDYKYKSEKIHFIDNIKIISIATGADHILALSESGEIYSWGYGTGERIGNERVGDEKRQLIPHKIEKFAVEKVIMVSCGFAHSMALTENGHVYAWGYNEFGQLGTGNLEQTWMPKKIFFESGGIEETLIEYICGGFHHSLALSRAKDVYMFGTLDFKQKRSGTLYEMNSHPFRIDSIEKFVAIASHIQLSVAAAISMEGFCYVWGDFCGNILRKPRITNFVSFNDLFRHYFNITFNLMDISKELKLHNTEGARIIKPKFSNTGRYSDQFEEIVQVGSGSFGEVFKVKDKLDEQFYAIKIIEMGGK
jgi:alpha-tubulin suppressor-like RCC1 family protein